MGDEPVSDERVERMRRSVAMLAPGTMTMTREDAMTFLTELTALRREMAAMRASQAELLALHKELTDRDT